MVTEELCLIISSRRVGFRAPRSVFILMDDSCGGRMSSMLLMYAISGQRFVLPVVALSGTSRIRHEFGGVAAIHRLSTR